MAPTGLGSAEKSLSRLSPSSPRSVGERTEFGEHGDYLLSAARASTRCSP